MVRERRRLLIPPGRLAQEVLLSAAETHYLKRVLRIATGGGCDVVDGAGRRWSAVLVAEDRLRLEQPLQQPLEQQPRREPTLVLAMALPRQEVELVWRMATELGIDFLQPLLAERCVGARRWPLERWQAILREATEQCERLWIPELGAVQSTATWFRRPWLDPEGPRATNTGLHLLATSRGERLPHWQEILPPKRSKGDDSPEQVCVAIGPEGGWSPVEEADAAAHGWIPVTGGPTILRTATAAVAASAWMAGWRAGLSSS